MHFYNSVYVHTSSKDLIRYAYTYNITAYIYTMCHLLLAEIYNSLMASCDYNMTGDYANRT